MNFKLIISFLFLCGIYGDAIKMPTTSKTAAPVVQTTKNLKLPQGLPKKLLCPSQFTLSSKNLHTSLHAEDVTNNCHLKQLTCMDCQYFFNTTNKYNITSIKLVSHYQPFRYAIKPNNTDLKVLNIQKSEVGTLYRRTFASWPSLEKLIINKCNLDEFHLPGNLLSDNKNLTTLNLAYNKLRSFDFTIVHGIEKLTTVDISNNFILNINVDLNTILKIHHVNPQILVKADNNVCVSGTFTTRNLDTCCINNRINLLLQVNLQTFTLPFT